MVLDTILGIGFKLLDKVIPDMEARDKAKTELLKLQQEGQLKEMEASLSAIVEEARSNDPWTSRARPSFLYIMYILLLMAIPMGIFTILHPANAAIFTKAVQDWFAAIPEDLYWLFGTGYLGYTGMRTFEKTKGKGK